MRVITVDNKEFGEMCRQLMTEVLTSGYEPDVVVAVERAGVFVAKAMNIGDFYTVRCCREGSKAKKSGLGKVLRYLPSFVNVMLRKLEYHLLQWRDKSVNYQPRIVEINPDLKTALTEGNRKVLIVDDAADSGRSLKSVVDELGKLGCNNEIRTAVITMTRPDTICTPDYALFRDQTLIRFPWAADRNASHKYKV